MAQVISPTTLRIDESNSDGGTIDFLLLRDSWTSPVPAAHLPRPEAVLEFQYDVQSHYETQGNHDSDIYGRDLSLLDSVWGDFELVGDERIRGITDVFPVVSDVLRRMTNLERLVWGADLPIMYGIDDAIASLSRRELHAFRHLHICAAS